MIQTDMIIIGLRSHELSSTWYSRAALVNINLITETRITLTYPDSYNPTNDFTYRIGQIRLVPVDFIVNLNSL